MCLNGGSGTLTAMLRIGGLVGAFMVYYMILYGNPMQILKTWGMPVLLMTNMLFLPTSTVWIKDAITRYAYKIDHVPYGLALFASQTSKLGKVLTEIVEQSFSTPDDMKYQKNGMMFGSDILEKAKTFRITNQNFKENMRNFVGQCVKYDIMLNQKYSFDDLRNTNDLWGLITSNPSKNRGIFWIPITGKGMAVYVTCEEAAEKFNQAWAAELDRSFSLLGRKFFTGRFIANSGSNSPKLMMNSSLETALKAEIKANLQNITSYLGDIAENAENSLKQALMINAIGDAASENCKLAGNAITYAETRALQQQSSTFDTVGRLATKLLPIMKAVIEALAYACFIFIIPLCMVPSGYKFFMNWVAILIWLQAWPPMYAILNYIMNIAARASTLSELGTAGGLTIANYIGVSEANAEIKLLAGYLSMSIPFICIAIVKGVGTFVHLAGQMTGTSMQAASSAAAEVSSGNFSFGNVSMRNQQLDNLSQLQRSFSSSLSAGGHRLDTGGVQIINDASGFSTISHAVSSGVRDFSATSTDTEEFRKGYGDSMQRAYDATVKYSQSKSASHSETSRLAHSFSSMSAQDISSKYNMGADKAQQIHNDAKILDQYYNGHAYADGTKAGGNLAFGANAGGHIDLSKGAGSKKSKVSVSGSVAGQVGIGMNGGVESSNTTNYGDSSQASTSHDIAETQKRFDSYMQDIAASSRNDEVAQLARDHTDTLSKMSQYSQDKAYNEHMAKSYQESYNRASSLTISERSNLRDHALEIATERGYTKSEASQMIDSSSASDKEQAQGWLMEAKSRETVRMRPTMPQMKQPGWGDYNRKQAESDFRPEYKQQEQQTRTNIDKMDDDRKAKKEKLQGDQRAIKVVVSDKLQNTKSNISQEKMEIKNQARKIRQKEKERAGKGAAHAVVDKTINTFSWGDD
jgi:conjugal transfer mating pair stabilization protein TraG